MYFLNQLWKKWLKIAHVIGNFQGQVILTVFYFLIMGPFGIAFRIFTDPLRMKGKVVKSNFETWKHPKGDIETAKHQY